MLRNLRYRVSRPQKTYLDTHRGYIIENWILWTSHGPEKMGVAK